MQRRDELWGWLAELGVAGAEEKARVLFDYAEMLWHEGSRLSVHGYSSLEEILRQGIEDAAAAFGAAFGPLPAEGALVDVGSGGGLPGVVFAVLGERLAVTLVEAERRKVAFLEAVVRRLGLRLDVVWGRAEALARGRQREAFAYGAARALARPPRALEFVAPLVRPGGAVLLFVGPKTATAGLGEVAASLGLGEPRLVRYVLASGEARGLLVAEKRAPTPERFPQRRPGRGREWERGSEAWTP